MNKQLVLITVFLIAALHALAQNTVEPQLNMSFDNRELKEVIDYLDQTTSYSFSYSSSSIPMNTLVTVLKNDISIWEALDSSLEFLPISYQVINNNIILKYNDLHQTIRGTIVDIDTQQPIFGATVVVLDSNPLLGAVADMKGKFKIDNVPVGRLSLKINFVGYEERIISNVLLGSGKELVLEIELVESVIKMDELVIESTGVGSQAMNEMVIISGRSFSVEETKRFPVGLGDPLRLASSFAGVMGTDDITNEIIVRGNTPRGILWKMEGIEIPSPNHFSSEGASSGGVSMLSTQVMSRSDFYTGAFAAEYGNALSGVFDLHLRKGNNEKHEKTIQAGFLGLDVASEGPIGSSGSSYLFNYRYSTLSILNKLGLIDGEGEENIFQDLAFNLSLPTEKMGKFSVFGLGGLSSFKNTEGLYLENEDYDLGILGVTNQIIINSSTWLKSSISWSGTRLEDNYDNAPDYINYTSFEKSYWRGSLLLNKKFNSRHLLETGVTLSKLNFSFDETGIDFDEGGNAYPTRIFFDDHDHTWTQQAFTSWKFRVTDDLSFVNGFHIFRFDMNDEITFEPRSSLTWKFLPDQSLALGFGVHSRMESLEYYLGNGFDDNNNMVDHNRGLKVTRSNHYVMGYDKIFGSNLYFKVEAYYQHLYNIPILTQEGFGWFSTINSSDGYTNAPLVNEGTGRNYGIEMTLDRKFANDYYFLANVSLFDSKYTAKDGVERNTKFNGNYTLNVLGGKEWRVGRNNKRNIIGVNFKVSASGNQRYIPSDLTASRLERREVLDLDNIYSKNMPYYFRLDLQFSYRKNKGRHTSQWRLDLQNATNRENAIQHYIDYDQANDNLYQGFNTQLGLIPVLSYRIEF